MLRFEQRLGEGSVRLPQHDDVAPGGVPLSAKRDGVQGGADLHLPAAQDAEQRGEPDGVARLARDHVRVRPTAPATDRAALDREEIREPHVTVARRVLEQGVRGVGLVADDVPEGPAAAGPRIREVPRALARVEPPRPGREVVERDFDRGRQVGARRLGEDANAAVVVLVGAGRRPGVVDRVDRDPRLPLPGELPRDAGPKGVHAVHQQRVYVRLHRVEVRRQEESRAVAVLLMNVVHDLGMPHVVQRVDHELCLDLGEGVPVAVVVVPRVVVVQLGRVGAFGGRAERAVVPAGDDRDAVGVERGDEQQDHVVEDRPGGGGGVAREAVGEDRGRQVPAYFVRVDARRDEHDGAAVAQRLLRLAVVADGPRIGEPRVELSIAIEALEVLRARDEERDEGRAQRALPELAVPYAVARLRQGLVIAQQRRPVGEPAVLARLEAQDRLGSGDARHAGRRPPRPRGRGLPGVAALLPSERQRGGEQPRRQQRHGGARHHV